MSLSVVDVCNNALQKLGAARIASISDNSREARSCSVAYDSNRRSELRKYVWNFAVKRVVLAPDVTAPAFEYTYQFTLPSDFLRLLIPKDSSLDWVREGNKILTNSLQSPYGGAATTGASLSVRYIADITDVNSWDPSFFDMVSIAMAQDMCEDLTQSNTKAERLDRQYKDALIFARKSDAMEVLPKQAADDDYWLARF